MSSISFQTLAQELGLSGPVSLKSISDSAFFDSTSMVDYIGYKKPNRGEARFTFPGTYTFTLPDYIRFISVLCVGAGGAAARSTGSGFGASGGGGAGGGLVYSVIRIPSNNTQIQVVVGQGGAGNSPNDSNRGDSGGSSFVRLLSDSTPNLEAFGGEGGTTPFPDGFTSSAVGGTGSIRSFDSTYVSSASSKINQGGTGGANSDRGDSGRNARGGGAGGGAAGYLGKGGTGGSRQSNATDSNVAGTPPESNSGGGAGGEPDNLASSGGGGVGIFGKGADGSYPSGGGSGGNAGQPKSTGSGDVTPRSGGSFGGGGAGVDDDVNSIGGSGASGAVRIVWGDVSGTFRNYPSTNVAASDSLVIFENGNLIQGTP